MSYFKNNTPHQFSLKWMSKVNEFWRFFGISKHIDFTRNHVPINAQWGPNNDLFDENCDSYVDYYLNDDYELKRCKDTSLISRSHINTWINNINFFDYDLIIEQCNKISSYVGEIYFPTYPIYDINTWEHDDFSFIIFDEQVLEVLRNGKFIYSGFEIKEYRFPLITETNQNSKFGLSYGYVMVVSLKNDDFKLLNKIVKYIARSSDDKINNYLLKLHKIVLKKINNQTYDLHGFLTSIINDTNDKDLMKCIINYMNQRNTNLYELYYYIIM